MTREKEEEEEEEEEEEGMQVCGDPEASSKVLKNGVANHIWRRPDDDQ